MVVRHRQRVGEPEVDLPLSRPGLSLRGLHPHPGCLHAVADLAQECFVIGGREQVVVEDVGHGRRQARILLRVRLLEGLAEEVELQLAVHHRRVAERGGALELCLQDLARGRSNRPAVVEMDVAEDERRRLEPRTWRANASAPFVARIGTRPRATAGSRQPMIAGERSAS